MLVVGVNGWVRGVHDASAALFRDGRLLVAAEEERFIRQKHAFNRLPHNAIAYCLREAGVTVDEVDQIAVGWDLLAVDRYYGKTTTHPEILEMLLPRAFFARRRDPVLHLVPHHLAHAAGAFYGSGFPEATVVVIDGSGERESATIARGDADGVHLLESWPLRSSLGIFYQVLTSFVGFAPFEEGKTMGLAPYGTSEIPLPPVLDGPPNLAAPDTLRDGEVAEAWLQYLRQHTGHDPNPRGTVYDPAAARLKPELAMTDFYRNLAAAGQQALEEAMLALITHAVQRTGCDRVCISGGVALNCVANRRVALHPGVGELYIQPSASDGGVSVGAAAWVSARAGMAVQIPPDHVYGGPGYTEAELAEVLRRFGLPCRQPADLAGEVVEHLVAGRVVARFAGRMELGPRALGNRSILASPQRRETHAKVNQIKGREQWRPLAPSVIAERLDELMEEPLRNPYMLITTSVRPARRQQVAAVVHVDGSTRAQAVDRAFNEDYWQLLKRFDAATGIPALLNTSFNIGSEPIVCSPVDAIRSFHASALDALILGPFLLTKRSSQ